MRVLKDANPITAFVWIMTTAGIAMFGFNPMLLCTSLLGAVLYFFVRNPDSCAMQHSPWLLLCLLSALINPLVSHNGATTLFILNHNPVTMEAFIYGAVLGISILSVLYWFKSFQQIMTSDKLLYIFGSALPKLTLILSIALRYIPLLKQQAVRVRDTQKALGLFKEENLLDRLRGELRIFSVLVSWALENGIITADSMSARGYGIGRRTRFALFRFTIYDAVLCVSCIALGGYVIWAMSSGTMDFTFYPYIRMHAMSPTSVCAYAAYALMSFFPFILELEENRRWKSLKSKI